jgi:hypothetical protein
MTEKALKLSTMQLSEVYSAMWREFVDLHKQVTVNPHGLDQAVIERLRLKRTTTGEVCDMIEEMQPDLVTTIECYLTARAEAKIEADHGLIFATTRHGSSFVMPAFPNAEKPYDLSKLAPFAFPVPSSFRSRPSNEVLEIAELAIGLHGKNFATLTQDELKRFQLVRQFGSKFGLMVNVEVLDDCEAIQDEITAASPSQLEEIYRKLRTQIAVRWFAIDTTLDMQSIIESMEVHRGGQHSSG